MYLYLNFYYFFFANEQVDNIYLVHLSTLEGSRLEDFWFDPSARLH